MIQRNFVVFTASAFLFLIVFFTSSLIANQENPDKPSIKRSNPQSEISNPPSVNSNPSNLQSTIQNLSSTSIGEPKFEKADVLQKTKKLQMPFIANNGQTDEKVKFYANTFGGTVFVTKDGEIVYSLPHTVAHASPLVHYDIDKNETVYTGLTGYRGKEGQCIVHRALCAMYPYCPWNFPVYYSETNSPLKRGTHPLIPSREGNGVCNTTPTTRRDTERRVPTTTVALKEQFVGAKVKAIQGEDPSVTKVNYFKGNDPEKWKTNISTYDMVNLGEIYKGIELKLKAYGDNIEKLFCVKPGADPSQIKVSLSGIQPSENPPPLSPSVMGAGGCPPLAGAGGGLGARGLLVNEHGELEVETELGPVKFTKPVAYQEINGKRVDVSVEYRVESSGAENKSSKHKTCNSRLMSTNPKSAIQNPQLEYGFTVASYDKTKELVIDPLLASTYLGTSDYNCSIAINSSGNIYVVGTALSNFPTTTGTYDTSLDGYSDIFVSRLSEDLTKLLASTYLGGSNNDSGLSVAIDSSENIFVAGFTLSSNFPTTNGTYDTSLDGYSDAFVSKLNGDLTSLLASTYLGGSDNETGWSIAVDSSGNIFVAGSTSSSDFPAITGAYDTSFNSSISSGSGDAFVSKLNGTLTSLLASTYLGGNSNDSAYSIVTDSNGNIFLAGVTGSSNFPTTVGAYDTSYNSGYDAFVSKLNSDLTSLLSSTYLGGSAGDDYIYSMIIDTGGNIYAAGWTTSSDFPTTTGAYNTSYNGGDHDAFISKINSSLTNLLASTYLGGSDNDYIWSKSIAIDTGGNIYVTGYTGSSNFPTTTGTYDTSYNYYDTFVSKINGNLASLQASTYLGGSSGDSGRSIAIDSSGNIYVTGYTSSSDFPITNGAYDTSYNGGSYNIFVSKFDNNLSVSPTTATTGSATNITLNSVTLNGTINAQRLTTTVWFEYGTTSGSYGSTSSTQTISGFNDTTISSDVSGLSSGTTYYYRIVAQNSSVTTYGTEMSFATLSDNSAPTGSISINSNAVYTNSTSVTLKLSATDNLGVTGYYISTSFATPTTSDSGWTSITSTTNYTGNISYTLSSGDGNKTVYAWYKDSSGNISNSAYDSIILDMTSPTITITSPTSGDTYTVTNSVIAIGGNASDSTSGISSVTWSNDKGGNGTASGKTGWLTSSISLLSGDNVITVTAKDGAGNSGTDTLQVTYSPSGTVSVPTASTGSATNITSSTATLNGTVNANGASTTVWFQYGTDSGSYGNTSSSQVVSGSSNTTVSISISSLSSNTTYYYRVVASNSAGTSYGSEASFATKTVSTTPTPTTSPAPTLSPLPTPVASPSPAPTLPPLPTPIPTLTPEPNEKGTISGYIVNKKGYPIESAKIRLKGTNSKILRKTISDADGEFAFIDVDADTYIITAIKKGYKLAKQPITLTLEEGEVKREVGIEMKKTKRR